MGRGKKVKQSEWYGGKKYWGLRGLRGWNMQIEVNILKKDKSLSDEEAVDMAIDLLQNLLQNAEWKEEEYD